MVCWALGVLIVLNSTSPFLFTQSQKINLVLSNGTVFFLFLYTVLQHSRPVKAHLFKGPLWTVWVIWFSCWCNFDSIFDDSSLYLTELTNDAFIIKSLIILYTAENTVTRSGHTTEKSLLSFFFWFYEMCSFVLFATYDAHIFNLRWSFLFGLPCRRRTKVKTHFLCQYAPQ